MRLFVSVPLPAVARDHLAAALRGVRTTAPDRWHVTLAFLGEQDGADHLLPGLAAVAAGTGPFALRVDGGGTFPGVLWAGVDGDLVALGRLAEQVAGACRAAGVELDRRRYRPHVTVARRAAPALLDGYRGPPWTVRSFDLVRSRLGRQVRHDVVRRLPLPG